MRSLSIAVAVLGLLTSACAGARHSVRFDSASYPISMTSAVPVRERGGKLRIRRNLDPVGRFRAEQVGKSIFWTLIPLNKVDFSSAVNAQIRALEGDAVTNLMITASDTGFDTFSIFSFLNWLPFWPGDVKVIVEGDIVRAQKSELSAR